MKPGSLKTILVQMLAIAGCVLAVPSLADKPSWAGGGKDGKEVRKEKRENQHAKANRHFDAQQQAAVREYYAEALRGGRCPPGLAKKQNGCMPPGQARKWKIGQPLPRDVIFHTVPQELVIKIGLPPSGHRYVRVAGDILLIATGTAMVVDAIQDLGR